MTRLHLIPAVLGLLFAAGCSIDGTAEAAKLAQRDADWAKASLDGKDVEKIVSYWSDDARVLESGQPAYSGKAAIRAFVTASLKIPGFKIHWVSEKPVLSPDAKMAYMLSDVETTAPGANGALVTTHGRSVTIWRRDGAGEWLCVVDISNDPPAEGAAVVDRLSLTGRTGSDRG
jgi:ketosteroid isomerase-like protein